MLPGALIDQSASVARKLLELALFRAQGKRGLWLVGGSKFSQGLGINGIRFGDVVASCGKSARLNGIDEAQPQILVVQEADERGFVTGGRLENEMEKWIINFLKQAPESCGRVGKGLGFAPCGMEDFEIIFADIDADVD